MKKVQLQDDLQDSPYPCDYFDMMGGTSTGGIIALMLGRLRMPVTEVIRCYHTLSKDVFSNKKKFGDGRFKAKKLEEIIRDVITQRTGNGDERMLDTRREGDVCKTFVCAMPALHISSGAPHLFRTYRARTSMVETFNCTIWEAARATSAAPTFFKPIKIGEPGSLRAYVDGGMSCNNPIWQVVEEAAEIFPDRDVACIISIGTGRPQIISIQPPNLLQRILPLPLNVLPAVRGITVDSEQSARRVAERFKGVSNFYFRLNVERGLEDIGLDGWERLDDVAAHTQQYIQDEEEKMAAASVAICEGQRVVSTAHICGRIQSSGSGLPASHRTYLKKCPLPARVFTGREKVLAQMREYFLGNVGDQRIFVLYGLGGAGKSQIAFKFVKICQIDHKPSRFSEVFFIDASTAETINTDLQSVALAKAIGESMEDTLRWLAEKDEDWLLIFNNADDTTFGLGSYFPECAHGNILITTRNRDLIRYGYPPGSNYHVSGMETEEGCSLLLKVAGLEKDSEKSKMLAVKIVEELGNLALAVVQAGAYISRTQCGLSRYLELFREHRESLLGESDESGQKIDSYAATVYTTWKISFDKLSYVAAKFLQICSFMHHEGVSEAIFRNAAVNMKTFTPLLPMEDEELDSLNMAKEFLGSFRTTRHSWDVPKFLNVTSEIHSYSLMDFEGTQEAYSVHPLVHSWTRTTVSRPEPVCTCVKIILGVSVNFKYELDDYAFRRNLLQHVDMALRGSQKGLCVNEELGLVYWEAGRWKEAEELEFKVKEARMKMFGSEHPHTLTSMKNLALSYGAQGLWKEAEELEVEVKEARVRVLGPEHPETLGSLSNLAVTYEKQGRWKEAEELQVEVKEAFTRVLGPEHSDTLTSMGNLAVTYGKQGRWKEAEELQVEVKEVRTRVLGPEHPDTLTSMGNLAVTYGKQGRWKEAEELQVEVKEARALGPDHPDTLINMGNLAVTYENQGRLVEAGELQVKVKEAFMRARGPEHPDTLGSMRNLAVTYGKQGRLKEAEELIIEAKETRARVLGPEHPDTLASMEDLAMVYEKQRRWKEAEELQVEVKEARVRVLGPEHPETLSSMGNLTVIYEKQGRWKEMEEMEVKVKEARARVLGPEHPNTLVSMGNLALTYEQQGRLKEAEELEVQVKEARTRVLGPDHPETVLSMGNLAVTYRKQGRWKEAEELLVEVKEAFEKLLGPDHPNTLWFLANLAATYEKQGRLKEAEELALLISVRRLKVAKD